MGKILTALIIIEILLMICLSANAEDELKLTEQEILAHLAPELEAKCIEHNQEYNYAKDCRVEAEIVVFPQRTLEYQGHDYIATMAGCDQYGQFILCEIGDKNRFITSDVIELTAGQFFPFKIEDINNDGIGELPFLHASVAMGTQMVFFSVTENKLIPLTYGEDSLFFITSGHIEITDLDDDKINEIVLTALVWPPDSTGEGEQTIYKWDGQRYQKQK